jgi:two-component system, sensor histidine kinase and response regulator
MTANGGEGLVVDPAAIARLREWGGDALVGRMIELFLELGPERAGAIRIGLDEGDQEGVERAAHSLKSSAGNLGAEQLRRAAHRLEESALGSEDPHRLRTLAEELLDSYERTAAALERLRPEAVRPPETPEDG